MVFQVKIDRLGYFHGPPPEMGFFSSMVLICRSYQILCRNSDKVLGWQAIFYSIMPLLTPRGACACLLAFPLARHFHISEICAMMLLAN